jgi:hypothetical protein
VNLRATMRIGRRAFRRHSAGVRELAFELNNS